MIIVFNDLPEILEEIKAEIHDGSELHRGVVRYRILYEQQNEIGDSKVALTITAGIVYPDGARSILEFSSYVGEDEQFHSGWRDIVLGFDKLIDRSNVADFPPYLEDGDTLEFSTDDPIFGNPKLQGTTQALLAVRECRRFAVAAAVELGLDRPALFDLRAGKIELF